MGTLEYLSALREVVEKYRELLRPKEVRLPRLVPLVTPDREAISVVEDLGLKACIVEYHQLPQLEGDPHSELGFDGYLILSAVMPDDMLEDPSTFEAFVETAAKGFDAVIGWDMPVEVDIPEEESWRNLVACLERTAELALELDVPVIPLSKGASEEQAEAYVKALSELGFKTVALHASEYAQALFREGLARKLLDVHLKLLDKHADQVLVIGVLNPRVYAYVRQYDKPKFSYAGMSWLIDAERGYAYTRRGKVDLRRKVLVVGGRGEPLEYPWKKREIAAYNLDYTLNLVYGAGTEKTSVFDMALSGTTIIVADAHAGTPDSMLEEMLDVLRSEDPDTVVFLGDTFDLERGYLLFVDMVKVFGDLAWVSPKVLAVKGDADSNFQAALRAIDEALTLRDSARTLPGPRPTNYHLMAFYKFYRFAEEAATAYLPNYETAYMTHGHTLGTTRDAIVRRARAIRRQLGADWVFYAHTHKPELDRKEKIANPGSWVKSGHKPGTYILVEKDGEVTLLEA